MVNYPYKKSSDIIEQENNTPINYANRGMNFEHAVNLSNTFYKEKGLALITKRPTPIHINKVDYSKARIVDAYFEKQSTTDYNGVYKGRYIDFECKETKSKSSLPMHNISKHQIEHLKSVINYGGIAFFLIYFTILDEVYLLDAKHVIKISEEKERKSIPYSTIKEFGVKVKQGYMPRLEYLDAIEKAYFNEENTILSK